MILYFYLEIEDLVNEKCEHTGKIPLPSSKIVEPVENVSLEPTEFLSKHSVDTALLFTLVSNDKFRCIIVTSNLRSVVSIYVQTPTHTDKVWKIFVSISLKHCYH